MKWQPIETLPFGRRVLIWMPLPKEPESIK